jgi:hypothetical protein
MSHDYFQPIINPTDPKGEKVKAVLPHRLILMYYKYYPVRYENLRAAKFVLENPERIFNGVRQFNEGGWCFTGRPRIWHVKEDVTVPFPDDLVFAVYLNSRFVVYECRAERAATDDPNCPEDWQNRYSGLVWKNIS